MKSRWDALLARAAGLSTGLLPGSSLDELSRVTDLDDCASRLMRMGVDIPAEGASLVARLEHGIRRFSAAPVRILASWGRPDPEPVLIFLRDEDRRSLRRLSRGALAGRPSARRLSGLIPTVTLPERILGSLARCSSIAEIGRMLVAWGNPFGSPLLALGSDPRPDPLAVETALDRRWAELGRADARRVGGEFLRYVEDSIDFANARSLLVLITRQGGGEAAGFFLDGGRRLDRAGYLELAKLPNLDELLSALKRRLAGSAFAHALVLSGESLTRFEDVLLREQVREATRRARLEPLGGASLLRFLLRLRVQVVAVSRAVWGCALAAPPSLDGSWEELR